MSRPHRYTPGPWPARYGDDPEVNPAHPRGGTTFRIFPHVEIGMRGSRPDRLVVNAGGFPMVEHDANARVIGAAPDLVAALEYARLVIDQLSEKAHARADREYCARILRPGNSIDAALDLALGEPE